MSEQLKLWEITIWGERDIRLARSASHARYISFKAAREAGYQTSFIAFMRACVVRLAAASAGSA